MAFSSSRSFLFVHTIWATANREPLLTKPLRAVLFSHIQKHAGEKGIQILGMNGVEDHVHCLFQLLPTQNLVQVMKTVKTLCTDWINTTQLLKAPFEWEEWFAAYTVSPSGIKPILDFIAKQEEHHATRTLDNELEVFDIMQADIKQYS